MGLVTAADFPELTSFGTLFKFALVMERAALELASLARERKECMARRDDLSNCARRHRKRLEQLERVRRERLNEVVLQRIHGMEGPEYMPALGFPEDATERETIERVIAVEETAARFYEDAASIAANVLAGVDRTLRKLAQENRALAEALKMQK